MNLSINNSSVHYEPLQDSNGSPFQNETSKKVDTKCHDIKETHSKDFDELQPNEGDFLQALHETFSSKERDDKDVSPDVGKYRDKIVDIDLKK